ncbi:MAG: hypothetical protein JXR25_06505 [Pontiellaceae bacterium]|nr:hypothetical protein [Pontiellaceae bacterium]MBN2784460.1 hypothetical protein [Pontiellaceae bacterium]
MKKIASAGIILLTMTIGGFMIGGQLVPNVFAQENTDATVDSSSDEPSVASAEEVTDDYMEGSLAEETNAPAVTLIQPSQLPPDLDSASPAAELARLVQAGVDENVILAYVKQSPRFFELDADTIIYLSDIGTASSIIHAAMARDAELMNAGISTSEPKPAPSPETGTGTADIQDEEPPEVAVDTFYDALSPYGSWIEVDGYGRVWRPTVVVNNSSWRPYLDNGRWVYTDRGWYWMSNYSWGWAAFHYGRWFHHARYGWCWWPDSVWAPSWVSWRYDNTHYGWAPLPPHAVYRPGVGLVYHGRTVNVGFGFDLGYSSFTFVSSRDFHHADLCHYRIAGRDAKLIYGRTKAGSFIHRDPKMNVIVNPGIPSRMIYGPGHPQPKPVSVRYRRTTDPERPKIERIDENRRILMVEQPIVDHSSAIKAAQRRTRNQPQLPAVKISSSSASAPVVTPVPVKTAPAVNAGVTRVKKSEAPAKPVKTVRSPTPVTPVKPVQTTTPKVAAPKKTSPVKVATPRPQPKTSTPKPTPAPQKVVKTPAPKPTSAPKPAPKVSRPATSKPTVNRAARTTPSPSRPKKSTAASSESDR